MLRLRSANYDGDAKIYAHIQALHFDEGTLPVRFPLRFSIRFPSPLSTMDHLPRPKHMDSNPLKIPFLARVNYDGNGFESFPSRYGFDLRDRSALDIASFAQAWLYFGLLAEFIGEPISPFVSFH